MLVITDVKLFSLVHQKAGGGGHGTYDFVLFAVPDGSAEQTLDLVAGVVWILTLSEKHCGDTAVTFRRRNWEEFEGER